MSASEHFRGGDGGLELAGNVPSPPELRDPNFQQSILEADDGAVRRITAAAVSASCRQVRNPQQVALLLQAPLAAPPS